MEYKCPECEKDKFTVKDRNLPDGVVYTSCYECYLTEFNVTANPSKCKPEPVNIIVASW